MRKKTTRFIIDVINGAVFAIRSLEYVRIFIFNPLSMDAVAFELISKPKRFLLRRSLQ